MALTDWDPFAVVLQSSHLDNLSSSNKITKKMYGTKNNCLHEQLGQILDKRYRQTKKTPTATFEEPGSKAGSPEQKARH